MVRLVPLMKWVILSEKNSCFLRFQMNLKKIKQNLKKIDLWKSSHTNEWKNIYYRDLYTFLYVWAMSRIFSFGEIA